MRFRIIVLVYFFILVTLVAVGLGTASGIPVLSNLTLWQFIIIGCIFAAVPILHLVFEYLSLRKHLNQVHELNQHLEKIAVSTQSQQAIQANKGNELNNKIDKLNQRLEEMATELTGQFESLRADKIYIERRLHDLVEVELALLPDGASNDFKVAGEGANLLNSARQRQQKLAKEMDFAQQQQQSRIKEVYLAELFDRIEKVWVPIGAINEETGHANHVDLLYVSAIAKHLQCQNLFEFGTYIGRTSYHLTYASDNAVVYTLNLPPEQDTRISPYLATYFRDSDREPFIKQILGDSREFDTTPYRQKMDLIFVDGDHSYELVKNDTTKAFEMLAPGGVIIWHDYAAKSPGVAQFFKEFTQHQPVFRIKNTCLLLHIDGIDPMKFDPQAMRPSLVSKTN